MKTILSISLALAMCAVASPQNSRPAKYGKHSTIFYDKFKNITTVTVETQREAAGVRGTKTSGAVVTLSAAAVYEGESTDKLKEIFLKFHAVGRGQHFSKLEDRGLIILLDGERVVLGTANLDDSHVGADIPLAAALGSGNFMTEDMSIAIPRETFLKLTTATAIEMQLGSVEWKLKAEHQNRLAELPVHNSPLTP